MALILDGTNGLSDVDGTAGTPAIRGSDANTGVFFGTDIVGVSTGGTERMRVDASGNVGIGTSSPVVKFAVQDTERFEIGGASGVVYSQALNAARTATVENRTYGSILTYWTGAAGAQAERARIDSSGNLLVGTTTPNGLLTVVGGTSGGASVQAGFGGVNATSFRIFHADGGGSSATACVAKIERVLSTSRSVNAAGTINASGADYAEYMTKSGDFIVAKGDVVGINAEGKLTNVFAEAISFCVKSTDPSYVGNDKWGCDFKDDQEGLEAARQCVDRIAFAGQVPVNVLGATPGQFIIPVDDNGAIAGQAVSNPTFEQYQIAVGKVIAIDDDGRARIIVKVS